MKLHFEDNLDYQQDAIKAVVGLFKGQEISQSPFTITGGRQYVMGLVENELGVGNRLSLSDKTIHENLKEIQLENHLAPSETLDSGDFSVEMETGTGKTYVYLRTIFELNKEYGFTKFVIVVPSVAIKEGTNKTLEITRDHFESLYPNAKGYEFFQYDSSKLGRLRNFATNATIQIMVITVGAINKQDVNNLYKENENTGGEAPLALIQATHPIIIVDEPQSVDGGLSGRGKEALGKMNPLATLRYSATHIDKHHMVYRLDAVDAYEKGLVKQIEVASLQIDGGYNRPFVRLIETQNLLGKITAKVELYVKAGNKVISQTCSVWDGCDLEQRTNNPLYENMRIGTITCGKNNQSIEVNGQILHADEALSDANSDDINRLMIHRTIKEHLDKEMAFKRQGRQIKVLSLFFIDKVENYRLYDEDGSEIKGKYAQMFEQEYQRLARSSDYQGLFERVDLTIDAAEVHDGYFSIDKKHRWTDTAENKQVDRDNAERAYNLIMKDKEKLLSFDTKLKFIFSHSALREGWDNPNVFQICSMREMGTDNQRRQTIGRGLRLCVDQDGVRLKENQINTLTVIAREDYEKFAENLQKEIERDTNIRFGVVSRHEFAFLGVENSKKIWALLNGQGLIDNAGKIQDTLRVLLRDGTFEIHGELEQYTAEVTARLKKLAGRVDIKNANERKIVELNEKRFLSADFKELWDRIKHKTIYRVQFDSERLIRDAARAIDQGPIIAPPMAIFKKAGLGIGKGGLTTELISQSVPETVEEWDIAIPDIVTELQDKTQLTRRSIVRILLECNRLLLDFPLNPQAFIEMAIEAINRTKRASLVDGIKYQKIGEDEYYCQTLFEKGEKGYLSDLIDSPKSIYPQVVCDSGVERNFVEGLNKRPHVKVYAKLPSWFTIPTPLGTYNPDWAILVEKNGEKRLYFVVETKGSTWFDDLRPIEGGKIRCGEKHFEALAEDAFERGETPAQFILAETVEDIEKHLT